MASGSLVKAQIGNKEKFHWKGYQALEQAAPERGWVNSPGCSQKHAEVALMHMV